MDSKRFPFDKLMKMLLIVASITVPLGFYYFQHVQQQTDYLNQRNFRALNEIILQYQNHFEALSNLFKFPAPEGDAELSIFEEERRSLLTQHLQLLEDAG